MAVNIDDFGAIGDGLTDDAPAIKRAEQALGNHTGRVIEFSARTYALATRFETEKDGITYRGVRGSTKLIQIGQTEAFKIQNNDITIEDMVFEGDQSNSQHRQNQIEISSANNALIRDVDFLKSSSSAIIVTSDNSDIRIISNRMIDFYENAVDIVQSDNKNVSIIDNFIRTSLVSPNPAVSRPSGFTMEPQSSGVNDGWIIKGNLIDFSGLSAADRNNTFCVACQKHALPASDFVLTGVLISDNVMIGAGHAIRLLDTRYGNVDQSFIGMIIGNMIKHARNHAILVRGGEDDAEFDSLVISGNSINGFSQSTTTVYDGIKLSQNLRQPLIEGNYINARSGDRSISTKGKYGIDASDTAVVSQKIGLNSIFEVQQQIHE